MEPQRGGVVVASHPWSRLNDSRGGTAYRGGSGSGYRPLPTLAAPHKDCPTAPHGGEHLANMESAAIRRDVKNPRSKVVSIPGRGTSVLGCKGGISPVRHMSKAGTSDLSSGSDTLPAAGVIPKRGIGRQLLRVHET